MALLIDRDWVTLADLAALDSEIPEIADSEGIVVEGEGGVIREAWMEAANWLESSFPAINHAFEPAFDSGRSVANRFRADQVVASFEYGGRTTPLVEWLRWLTLVGFYRSAVRRTTSDRYAAKADDAALVLRAKLTTLKRSGIPVVSSPLPCPAAAYFQGSAAPSGVVVAGGSVGSGVLYWAATWLAADGVESGPSAVQAVELPELSAISVNLAGSLPEVRNGIAAPTGWRLYAGSAANRLQRAAEALGSTSGSLTAFAAGSGPLLSNGQVATVIVPYRNLILRG